MANMDLSLTLKAKDYASGVIKSVENSVSKSTKNIESQAQRSATTQQRAVRQTAQVTEQSYRQIQQAARNREMLGVRSERSIQSEINRTRSAYDQLKRSGIASGRELDRAAVATKRRIAELNAEMGKVSMGQRLGNVGRGIAGLAAGATAAGMVLAQPMKKQMDYDRSLAMTANTAFAERDVAGRIAGKAELNNAVKSAVEIGGGTKEDALGALDTMLASGAVKAETAMKLLPTLQKGATATGASTDDLAKIAISAMQQFDISEDKIGEVLDKAVAAGQAGNFELADMARWLPQQMAAGKSAGLKGMSGFEALLVANQQARVTAGTSDEAGNNLVNLLAKLTSKETSDRFRKLDIKGKDGKDHGVDFIASMEAQKKKGKNSIEAFMSIMDQVIGQDGKYQALQKKLKNAKKEDQAQVLNEMTNLVEGTAIGQIISDRQALMALLGIRNNVSLGKEVKESLDKSEGAVETSHAVIKDTNSYKVEDAKNNVDFAQMEGMKGFNDALGDVSVKIAEYAKAYPDLTGKLVTAGTVVASLSAAAITAAGSLRLLGGKGGLWLGAGDALSKGAGVTGVAGGAAAAANTAKKGSLAKFGLGGLPLLVFGAMLEGSENYAPYMAQQEEQREAFDAQHKDAKQQFYASAYPAKSAFQYAPPMPKPEKSVWSLASGGYALGDAAKRKEIADERLKRGTLTKDEYNRRVQVPDYKTEFQQLGNTITEGMKQAVESQNFTIQNQIRVDLDGRTIAESTSENQYRELKRG
ncbi:TPA: phage tail tape measure protein [Haemophilus influenzae]|nr:phage tail tape measure protein [Haemophilus influenzae]MCK8807507.1 phage tail tape measure protein [Haemophilus influenzae]MCK9069687.1 phage tail tape measure protein [Haemophilus influenzae]PRI86626.1 Phage-related minor tail protein [Haemophilus influenzae]PRL88143.1 Phage-related minor tail protein [Haemophilus influenzae]RFO78655.1 phage tail tape measure protein [Haemophilus influenzae]